jgi:hypothetical protein
MSAQGTIHNTGSPSGDRGVDQLAARERQVSNAYRAVDQHALKRLRQWLCAKHKVVGAGTGRFPETFLYQVLGLVRLTARTGSLPWATS